MRTTALAGTVAGLVATGLATGLAAASPAHAAGIPHNEQVVLVNDTNAQADAKSAINGTAQVASYDGSYVVFSTQASLVPQDKNDVDDVYMRDTRDGFTILVSRLGAKAGNDSSFEPTIDDEGRYIAFTTAATNLVKGDTNGVLDVVVKDMYTGKITRVSVGTDGTQGKKNSFFPVISGDGSRVAFQTFSSYAKTDADKKEDVYVHDVARVGVVDEDLELHLGDEAHLVLGAAVDLGVAALATVPLDLADRHALDPEGLESGLDVVELEGLEDRGHQPHVTTRLGAGAEAEAEVPLP